MYDIHWKSVDRLAQDDNPKKDLRYNSNLSRVRFRKHYLYDWLPCKQKIGQCVLVLMAQER